MVAQACGSESKKESGKTSENTPPAVNTVNPVQSQTSDPVPVNNTAGTSTKGTTLPVSGNSAGLNPAHGEPGHRCDIPVGSPLSGKPTQQPEVKNTQAIQPTVISQPSPTTVQPAGNTTSASGLNPAHGQPGHRCDIPVGSPLNSKPTQTTAAQGNTLTLPSAPQKGN